MSPKVSFEFDGVIHKKLWQATLINLQAKLTGKNICCQLDWQFTLGNLIRYFQFSLTLSLERAFCQNTLEKGVWGSPDYGSMVLYGWRVQSDSWPYSCHLLT